MSDEGWKDPLECFHPQCLVNTPSKSDAGVIESAKNAIDTADQDTLTPETFEKYQMQLKEVIDISPNKIMIASYLLEHVAKNSFINTYLTFRSGCEVVKTGGRRPNNGKEGGRKKGSNKSQSVGCSIQLLKQIKASGICQVTGGRSQLLHRSHILPFSASNDDQKTKQYLELVKALFGPDTVQRLLENVLNGDKEATNHINRLDNGVAMDTKAHDDWDAMHFYLEVLWETYNSSTKEFDVKFHWISSPQCNMINYWNPPFTAPDGSIVHYPLRDNDIIPIRHRNSPSSTSTITPSPASTPSFASTRSRTSVPEPFLPSAYLLYIREILTLVARAMGVAGYTEYDYYDDNDDVSVLASDLGEEETGGLSDPEQAEEKMSQVAAWAKMSGSYILEQMQYDASGHDDTR